ncbi:rho GTPase-activating protein 2-like [Lolium perenne]|uniref:rho GTPase-activating protein 2-like n=1 Tax=Lolium perenne TaxID=4522 RepID=UPI0021F692FA|nr:rho GTPase-activating protein 2-like [Lolium perenne]
MDIGGGGAGAGKEVDQVAGGSEQPQQRMKIGWPTEVRHVAHVTFDRFHGFRGVPAELQPEPALAKAPSASKTAFGVSTESMQCAHDARGNSVPSILLHLQRRLYDQGGLTTEGIFRVAADGAQEQRVRQHLDLAGTIPDDDDDGAAVDVHCLAGLIKAWFRELPGGLLDALPEEEVARCTTAEEAGRLCGKLAPAKAALLDWAVQLMADVASEEGRNRMGARNVAMVFAPNMTQAADPLTALKYAVQVMNFLNQLIERALRQRREQAAAATAKLIS